MAKKNKIKKESNSDFSIYKWSPTVLHLFFSLVCLVIVALVYKNHLGHGMVFDSPLNLTETRLIDKLERFSLSNLIHQPRYMVWLIFGSVYSLFGMDETWFRIVNLSFHMANTVLVYIFANQLLRAVLKPDESQAKKMQVWAFMAAFVFGVNPAAIYAVIYIVQLYIVLATFFSLLSLITFMKGLNESVQSHALWQRAVLWFYAAVVFYFLAVHSKEHAVLLPLVMLALMVLLRRTQVLLLKQLILPVFLMAVTGLHITYLYKWVMGSVYEPNARLALSSMTDQMSVGEASLLTNAAHIFPQSVFNQMGLFFRYLYLWLVPDVSRMSLDLPLPFNVGYFNWPWLIGAVSFVVYAVSALFCLFKKGLVGLVGFALLFPLFLFGTEFATVRFHENFVLYRSYLWMTGFVLLVPLTLQSLSRYRIGLCLQRIVFITYALLLIWATHDRLAVFKDGLALWSDVVNKIDFSDRTIPSAYRSAGNYATALGHAGQIDTAIQQYRLSADLNPLYVRAWDGLGAALALKGNYRDAIASLGRAIKVMPNYKEAYYNLGTTYSVMNESEKAIDTYKKAIEIDPDYAVALYNLANSYLKAGRAAEALPHYAHILTLQPDSVDSLHNIAIAYAHLERYEEAIKYYKKTIARDPTHAKAYYNLANTLTNVDRYEEALQFYLASLKLDPSHTYALHNAGLLMLRFNKTAEAIKLFQQAVKYDPNFQPSVEMLANLAAKAKQSESN